MSGLATVRNLTRKRVSDPLLVDWCHPGWLLMHGAFLAVLGLVWVIDEPVAQFANWWYNESGPINGELHQLILSLSMYGQMLGIGMTILLILLFDTRRRGRAFLVGMMVLGAGLGSGLVKGLVGRDRPLESGLRTVIHGPLQGFNSTGRQSFPSGHTATAFALSYGLATLYPQTRVLAWSLACGVGLNRIITVRHFPSDVVAGAWIGFMLAAWISQLRGVRKMALCLHRWWRPREFPLTHRLSFNGFIGALKGILTNPALLIVVSLCIHWAGNANTPLWDRDEPRFATATREMLARGDWIVPTFNGELRPDKPILIYWLMGAAYHLLGDNTFAARFVSGLAGTAAAVCVFLLGRSMFNRSVGLLAGWILALSPMAIVESKLATTDALLLFLLTVCLTCLWHVQEKFEVARQTGGVGKTWLVAFGFWISLGLAILAKGPVALGVVAATILCFCLLRKETRWLQGLRFSWGIPVLLLITVPWCIAVQQETEGDFLRVALGHHVIKRSIQPLEGHRGIPGFYVLSLFGLMAPWAWMLPWSIGQHWERLRSDRRVAYLVSWAVGTLILFELVTTKLVHYYLPAYPAIALFLASAIYGRFGSQACGIERFDRRVGVVLWSTGLLLGLGMTLFSATMLPTVAAVPAGIVVLVLSGGLIVAGLLVCQNRLQRAFLVLASTISAAVIVASCQLLPALGKERAVIHVAQRIKEISKQYPVALWLYRDPSIIYNTKMTFPVVDAMRDQPMFSDSLWLARNSGPFVCPMTDDQLRWMSSDKSLNLEVVETLSRWDLKGLRQRDIHFVKVEPSAYADRVLQLESELRELMPEAKRVTFAEPEQSQQSPKFQPSKPSVASEHRVLR